MTKKQYYFLGFIMVQLVALQVSAQGIDKDTIIKYDDAFFKKVLNREFNTLLNGVPTLTVGNYLSINQKDSRATIGFSKLNKDGSILSFNFSGAAPAGVVTIAKNSRVTYDFSIGVQYHFFNWARGHSIDAIAHTKLKKKLSALEQKKKKDLMAVNATKSLAKLKKEESTIGTQKELIEVRLKNYENKETVFLIKDSIIRYSEIYKKQLEAISQFNRDEELRKMDSISTCLSAACDKVRAVYRKKLAFFLNKTKISKKLAELEGQKNESSYQKILNNRKVADLKLLTSIKEKLNKKTAEIENFVEFESGLYEVDIINEYNIGKRKILEERMAIADVDEFSWFSIGAKFHRNQFTLYNPLVDFSEQVTKESFNGGELTIQYSYYNKTPKKAKSIKKKGVFKLKDISPSFVNIGASFRYRDNLSDLSKITISEETVTGTNTTSTRSVSSDFKGFTGTYKDNLKELYVYSDIYLFLFNKTFAALHWNPSFQVGDGQKPRANMDLGLILSFKNPKDKNAIVNTELFYSMQDLTNSTKSSFRLFERNTIGLRLTVPLKFSY